MNRPLLSICIPTYNRYEKLRPMIEQLLSCGRKDFEVVIQDNCSTDGTDGIKNDIDDARVRVIENPVNIGGIINGYGALLDARGKYCMICLDKDCVLGGRLSSFLDMLEAAPSIKYGICALNAVGSNKNEIYSSQTERFEFFAYKSRHPSGMFWETKLFKDCDVVHKIITSKTIFSFFPELIFAEFACNTGAGINYKERLLLTETPEESAAKKTLTYDASQIFFFPKKRIFEFRVYLGQLEKLKLQKKAYLWLKVFMRGLVITTLGFKSVMRDKPHLEHYGITPRNVSMPELALIAFRYAFCILFSSRQKAFDSLFA